MSHDFHAEHEIYTPTSGSHAQNADSKQAARASDNSGVGPFGNQTPAFLTSGQRRPLIIAKHSDIHRCFMLEGYVWFDPLMGGADRGPFPTRAAALADWQQVAFADDVAANAAAIQGAIDHLTPWELLPDEPNPHRAAALQGPDPADLIDGLSRLDRSPVTRFEGVSLVLSLNLSAARRAADDGLAILSRASERDRAILAGMLTGQGIGGGLVLGGEG